MTWGRGSTRASRTTRALVLQRDPICQCPGCLSCTTTGCTRPSTDDDHIVPVHQGGTDDMTNRRGLCEPCHQRKSRAEAAAARHQHKRNRKSERHPGKA